MKLTIKRMNQSKESIDGFLSVNDKRLCDTAECNRLSLPEGTYPICLVKCKQYGRRVICLGEPHCDKCGQMPTEFVFNNTLMPIRCPMLKMGNGVVGRRDGSIIVGERVGGVEKPVWGSMIHTKTAYDRVFDCVRKNLERGHDVTLRIM